MITIKLYGHLGTQFGRIHKYAIRTPVEAVRALEANCRGFKKALLKEGILGYKVIVDGQDRSSKEEIIYPADTEIKFIPIVKGKGNGTWGWIKVIIGIIIVVVAVVTQNYEFVPTGLAMIYGGVTQILYKPPVMQLQDAVLAENNSSKYFDGPSGIGTQGYPVPLAYGKVMSGYTVVHAQVSTVES